MYSGRFDTGALLAWYQHHKRDLPWRHTRHPYRIWVSEIMLQQTQVRTVLPRYEAWLAQFPDIQTLAEADENAVLKAWEGLGYYRRARYLHRAAQQIMLHHDGVFPQRFDDIAALPGIGRSTAGAIASFCYDAPYPVLDGNVKRLLHRFFGSATQAQQWQQAGTLIVESGNPAWWNQATMELGATLCRRSLPLCGDCPVHTGCRAASEHDFSTPSATKTAVQDVHWRVHVFHRNEQLWLQKRPAHGIWAGLWAPPIDVITSPPPQAPTLIHQLSHRRLHLYPIVSGGHHSANDGEWFPLHALPAMPTGMTRLLELCRLLNTDAELPFQDDGSRDADSTS